MNGDGEMVGQLVLGGQAEFIRVRMEADGAGMLDRPNRFAFQIPLSDVQMDEAGVAFAAEGLRFSGRLVGERLVGTVQDGAVGGTWDVQPLQSPDRQAYRGWIGHYRLTDEREIRLSQDARAEGTLYFYSEQDRVVRLYPVGANRWLSERLERLSFVPVAAGGAATLTWEEAGRPAIQAEQVVWDREEDVRVAMPDYELVGTLLLPPGAGPHPAVILYHLASTHQRDYYRLFAEPFVERGIAAFIYDKRGSGDSTGPALFSEISELAEDGTAVFRALQGHPAVQADRIGTWGISNGAWVGALVAERTGAAAFVTGASVAGVAPARQEQIRRANVAEALGASPRAVALVSRLWAALFQFYIDGQWNAEVDGLLQQVYADEELQRLPKHPDHEPGLQPVPPIVPIEEIRSKRGGGWADGAFEVAAVYARLACPILCVWGADDTVVPVEEGRQRIAEALEKNPLAAYELRVIPQANHYLYVEAPPVRGILPEVMHNGLHNVAVAPGVRALMVEWAAACLGM